jgi:apolipoprotein N-acyltransferase
VAPVTIIGWLIFALYTALLWPVLVLCLRYLRKHMADRQSTIENHKSKIFIPVPLFLASAVLIVGIERMQGFFLGGFFWRFLAHSQYQNITLIQIADVFGAGGVSFLIAMVNGLVAELILSCRPRLTCPIRLTGIVLKTGVVGAAMVGAVLYGRWRIGQEAECVTAGPKVALLQSNVPQSVKRSFESGDDLFKGLMEQSKAAVAAGAELVVWPETMVQAYLDPQVWRYLVDPNEDQAFDKALREHAEGKAHLLVGAYGAELQQRGADRYLARYNSAFLYRPDGQRDPKRYDKIHLVPFGEVLPLRRSFAWLYELLMKIKFIPYNFDYSLDYGSHYTVFEMPAAKDELPRAAKQRFGVMICYEDTVPEIAREFALSSGLLTEDEQGGKNVDWMVNISNDGWFVRFKGDKVLPSTELPQHAAVCVFRAVENRLAVVRSVNTGISCVIDSSGRIRDGFLAGTLPKEAMARTGMSGWLLDTVPIDGRTTIFSRYGEWLDFSCELCVILLIIIPLSVRFLRSRKMKRSFGKVVK